MLERQWGRLAEGRRLARVGKRWNGDSVWRREEGRTKI